LKSSLPNELEGQLPTPEQLKAQIEHRLKMDKK
jgi:hypothetical protein